MNLPDLLMAGRFTAVEKYRQNLNFNWLTLHISGLKRYEVYDRYGKLVCRMNGNDTPCLALGCVGMSVDFEYGENRENFVAMLDFPELSYQEDKHCFVCDYNNEKLTLRNMVKLTRAQIIPVVDSFQQIVRFLRSEDTREHLQARLIFCDLFNLMLKQPDLNDPVADFKQKIELDATWKYTLEELSGQMKYNRDYLRREFQRRYQISPHEYRTKKRLQDIVNLLSNTSLSIKEIAFHLGMKNASYLNIFLKQHFNATPKQIRKQAQEESGKFI